MIDHDEIRARIRKRFDDLGLAMTGLWLKDAGIGQTTIRNFLEGRSNSLTVETVVKLAKALKTTDLWILAGENAAPQLTGEQIDVLVRNAMLETSREMTNAQIAHIVSSAIHEQLELLRSGGKSRGYSGPARDLGTVAQSHVPTKRSGRVSSRRT